MKTAALRCVVYEVMIMKVQSIGLGSQFLEWNYRAANHSGRSF
jgi:hypothetical protein